MRRPKRPLGGEPPHGSEFENECTRRIDVFRRRCPRSSRSREKGVAGRDRDRRRHRTHVRIFRLFRLCDRLGHRLPDAGLPLCRPAAGDDLLVRGLRARLHRAPARVGDLHCGRSALWPQRQADDRAVPARHGDRGNGLPPRLCAGRQLVGRAAVDPAYRAGHRARGRLGWSRLAALAQRARGSPRLVRDAATARRAVRPAGGQRPVRLLRRDAACRRLHRLGLALSVLRGLRDQRRRTVRPPPPRRHARVHHPVRIACATAGARARYDSRRRPHHRARRLRPARQLRAVPYGDGVPTVVDRAVHARDARPVPDDRGDRRGDRPVRDARFRAARRSHRSPHAARQHRGADRAVRDRCADAARRRRDR